MDNKENFEQLLCDYGYPKETIHRLMQDAEEIEYKEVQKRIMPYQDITAHRS